MGKAGGRRKKAAAAAAAGGATNMASAARAEKADLLDASLFLKRANDLKEEGNKKFQEKDYVTALERYDQALKLTPKNHQDRAIFHSNRAACLLQMKPVKYDSVVDECTQALEVHPQYSRALLRRARAYEAMGKQDLAMQDVQALLQVDSSNHDGLELLKKLKVVISNKQEAHEQQQNRPTFSGTSPAAVGASAVRGAPVGGIGPSLPARPAPKKKTKQDKSSLEDQGPQSNGTVLQENKTSKNVSIPLKESVDKLSVQSVDESSVEPKSLQNQKSRSSSIPSKVSAPVTRVRPLKLIYGHDIRLSQIPEKCKFKDLREIVKKRFSSSKSVLIKYKDVDGDLVTITSTEELRLAEAAADTVVGQKNAGENDTSDSSSSVTLQKTRKDPLRLYVVDVDAEQEPIVEEEDEEEEPPAEEVQAESLKEEENDSGLSEESDNSVEEIQTKNEVKETSEDPSKGKTGDGGLPDSKEVEIDDWLFEFAQLFRTQVGIDPDAHVDLHEIGMDLCAEALEETITSEEAQQLFEMAASKFQEVAALAFFNWGNVHMCSARKRIPLNENAPKEVAIAHLQMAYDWVYDNYSKAGLKYEEALRVKPDFYEGLLALGQQHFESAKLKWSLALAGKVDLTTWDSSETFQLFDSAEQKMQIATEMWEKSEEQRLKDLKDPTVMKREEIIKRKRKLAGLDDSTEDMAAESAEQAKMMRSQIHLFWGNMLFERSQVEYKLGLAAWNEHLRVATERFELAGASPTEIEAVLKNHASNSQAVENASKETSVSG